MFAMYGLLQLLQILDPRCWILDKNEYSQRDFTKIKKPELKMEILNNANDKLITQEKELIRGQKAKIFCDKSKTDFYIDVVIKTENESARAVIKNHHTNLVRLEKNN